MQTIEKKGNVSNVQVEPHPSKYAGKPLNSPKEQAAKNFESSALKILKDFGLTK